MHMTSKVIIHLPAFPFRNFCFGSVFPEDQIIEHFHLRYYILLILVFFSIFQNSCCRQVELDAIFKDIKPILGADEKCTKMLNYMICWVCDPNQHLFYSSQRQELTFCESFCDAILSACQTAIQKGELMAHFYQDGRQFCKNHNFHVPESSSNETCFPSRTLWQQVGGWRSGAISLQAPVSLYTGLSFLVNSLLLRFL
ncbi:hypothetical protein RvY_00912 [Ramazzottius varieornatus]|uniref:Folate receptor-like domain-containing protein n=1 Tax=Ramazzottius varieornatus TaxID=947166 RepID=A0A1D1UEU9_RAMVA|nr:hypothetical protein RvY_00912 [Ramazzottius varieornatus]